MGLAVRVSVGVRVRDGVSDGSGVVDSLMSGAGVRDGDGIQPTR